eukprot:5269345-Alexandrium_andersonii.AAC.1
MVDVYRPHLPAAFRVRGNRATGEALAAYVRTISWPPWLGSRRGADRLDLSTTVGSLGLVDADILTVYGAGARRPVDAAADPPGLADCASA